jgi:hypothetical protein
MHHLANPFVVVLLCAAVVIGVALYVERTIGRSRAVFKTSAWQALAGIYPPRGQWTPFHDERLVEAYPLLVRAVEAYRPRVSFTELPAFDQAWADMQRVVEVGRQVPAYKNGDLERRTVAVRKAVIALLRFAR